MKMLFRVLYYSFTAIVGLLLMIDVYAVLDTAQGMRKGLEQSESLGITADGFVMILLTLTVFALISILCVLIMSEPRGSEQ